MQQKHVVTAFLLHEAPDGDRFLLVRRSNGVRTHQGLWAGVSGYLEPGVTPEEQVRAELREETGLTWDDVELIAVGDTVSAPDPATDTEWTVHPFLFQVSGAPKVRLNWENVEARWVRPEEILEYETVPKLRECLEALYPLEAVLLVRGRELEERIERIVTDRQRGSSALAKEAASLLAEVATAATRLEDIERACQLVAGARPMMATIRNVALAVLGAAQAAQNRDPLAAAGRAARRLAANLDYASEGVARFSRSYLRGTVVTLSVSSTVLRSLLSSRDLLARVIVAEARPLMEGRILAEALAREGIAVELITEAQVPQALQEASVAVIGADAFLADGSAVNKVGSRLLALAAREQGKPFVVLADTLKLCPWSPGEIPVAALEQRPGEEVWAEATSGVSLRNVTFEVVPAELITRYVTEDGIRRPEQMAALARSGAKLWGRVDVHEE